MVKAGLRPETAQRQGFPRRRAFTLVELLVVIAIIAVLAAILSVGVSAAVAYIYRFTVSMEVSELETALTMYQQEYGAYPPCIGAPDSSVHGPATTLYYANQFDRHLDTAFRNNRENTGNLLDGSTLCVNAGDLQDPHPDTDFHNARAPYLAQIQNAYLTNLDASEALPFFLGGAAQYWRAKGLGNLIGLKKDPVSPLTASHLADAVEYYDFKPEQLVDLDGDGFPSYIPGAADGSTPLVYFAGSAYRDQSTASFVDRMKALRWPPEDGSYDAWIAGSSTTAIADGAQGGYRPGIVRPYINGRVAPGVFWEAEKYQLLSAGLDNLYGSDGDLDGVTDPDFPEDFVDTGTPVNTTFKFLAPTDGDLPWVNMAPEDEDNVANFTEGSSFGDIGLE